MKTKQEKRNIFSFSKKNLLIRPKRGIFADKTNLMKRPFFYVLCLVLGLTAHAQRTIVVEKGSAQSLLAAVKEANQTNRSPKAKPLYILIPDGFYDLGTTVLTQITGHHIALIGQSTEGTVIQNKPDFKDEGISKTAIFQNLGTDNYFQDLTLKNALEYYACGAAGRAVTLHDKGTRTICNRVRMLSYQDTYYTWAEDAQHYLKDTEIHGTVDFICGAGDVWFERCRIVTEKRTQSGKGRCVIAAPRTSQTPWGYVFNHCTIENIVSEFDYARGWHTLPRCIWLHTTLLSPEKLTKTRFDYRGMRTVESYFKEYASVDAQGRNITPAHNPVTFTLSRTEKKDGKEIVSEQRRTAETILTDDEARIYTVDNVFGEWHPDRVLQKHEQQARKLMQRLVP